MGSRYRPDDIQAWQQYWREVLWEAWRLSKKHFAALAIPALLVGVLTIVLTAWIVGWQEGIQQAIAVGVGVLAAIAVGIGAYIVNTGRAVYGVHRKDMADIATLEASHLKVVSNLRAELRTADAECQGLRTALAASRDEIASIQQTKRANARIVAVLLPKLQYATHELANRVKQMRTPEGVVKWKSDFKTWEHETKAAMEEVGCSAVEISSFWDFTFADLKGSPVFHENPTINNRMQWSQLRINALRRVINSYSENPTLL